MNSHNSKPSSAILFVDDEVQSTKYFKKFFDKEFNVIIANNVDDAWNIIESQHNEIAIIISDQRMPISSGVELLKRAKNKYPNIIRILTTGYSSLDDNIAAINQSNVFGYLNKPWEIDTVRIMINEAFKQFRANITLQSLGGSIAHEVRNPLNTISLSLNQIQDHIVNTKSRCTKECVVSDVECEVMAMVNVAFNAIKRANKLIDKTLSDIKGEDSNLEFSYIDTNTLITELIREFGYKDEREKSSVIIKPQNNHFIFKADQTVVIYILYNLLKNALYYIKDYPDSIVTIGAEEKTMDSKEWNVIYVHDTGPGIPPEIIPKLFNDFFTSGKKDGTGLGLSFCKRNMKIFDGDIIVELQYTPPAPLNKGEKEGDESQYTPPAPLNRGEKEGVKITNNNWTKFSMLFPKLSEEELIKAKEAIKQQTLKEQEEKRLKQLGQATIIENDIRQISNKIFNHQRTLQSLGTKQDILKLIKGKKAIIADDSPVSLTMLKNFLTTNGLEITTAQDGKELLNIYKNSLDQNGKSSFDLILTDINMGSSKTTEEEIRMLKDFSSKQSDFSQSNQNNLNGDFASLAIRRIEAQNNPDKIMADTQIRPYETNSKSGKIYIIAISGDGQEKDIRHFFNCGMNDYFIKGDRPELILGVMGRGIE